MGLFAKVATVLKPLSSPGHGGLRQRAGWLVAGALLLSLNASADNTQTLGNATTYLRVALSSVDPSRTSPSPNADKRNGPLRDFWLLWGERVGRAIDFVEYPDLQTAKDAAIRGEIDYLAAVPITFPEDGELFYSRPFARVVQAVASPKLRMPAADLAGANIRYERGTSDQVLASLRRAFNFASTEEIAEGSLEEAFAASSDPVFAPSIRQLLERLRTESLSASIHAHPLTYRHLFAASSTRRPDLARLFEEGLSRISSADVVDLEGTEAEVGFSPFFLDPRDRLPISVKQRSWLRMHPVVRLGASAWPPLTILETDGSFGGIGIETVRHLLGRVGVQLQVIGGDQWEAVIEAARRREIDGLGYVNVGRERSLANLDFTDPILRAPAVIVSRNDRPFFAELNDLQNATVLVPATYPMAEVLRGQEIEGMRVEAVPSSREAFTRLSRGEADAAIDYLPIARSVIRSRGISNLRVTASVEQLSPSLSTAIRSDWPELIQLLDMAIATKTREDEARILARFERPPPQLDRRLVVWLIAPLLVIIAGLGITLLVRRRRTARLIKESEGLLRLAAKISKSGSWQYDITTRHLGFTPEAYRLFGWKPGGSEPTLEQFVTFYNAPSQAKLREALEGPNHASGSDKRWRLELASQARPTRFHLCLIEWTDRTSNIGTVTDITDAEAEKRRRIELQSQVNQLERLDALGRLAGGIAHDFNNILSVSLSHAELALLELREGHPARVSVDGFIKASLRARDLVRQIQIFGRRDQSDRQRLDVQKQIRGVVSLLSTSLPPSIEITTTFADRPLWIRGSSTQIDQVLMNLGVNAGHAMPEGGRLHFAAQKRRLEAPLNSSTGTVEPGSYIEIQVSDTGIGIEQEKIPRVFEPYFTTKPAGEGTGLGLALVHGVIKDHGGALSLSSSPRLPKEASENISSIFTILLAEWDPSDDLVSTREHPSDRKTERLGSGERILVVEDEPELLETTLRILSALGFDPHGSTEPMEAVARFRECPEAWSLVVTDMLMPHVSGTEVASMIKAERPDCPVLLATGYSAEHDLKNAPVEAILIKPISSRKWSSTLRELLAKAPAASERKVASA